MTSTTVCVDPKTPHAHCNLHGCVEYVCCVPATYSTRGSVSNIGRSYPALTGDVVTEAHARYCRENGHATYVKDGQSTGLCPRCGVARYQVTSHYRSDLRTELYGVRDVITGTQVIGNVWSEGFATNRAVEFVKRYPNGAPSDPLAW